MPKEVVVTNVFIYTHDNRKQLEEFKRLLLQSSIFSGAENAKLTTVKQRGYRLLTVADKDTSFKFALITFQVNSLTVDRMKSLNKQAEKMFETDSIYGLKDLEGLEQLLALCNQETFGREYHPTIVDKAAYLWYSLATKQLFHNGNKRTALLAGLVFLDQNFIKFKIKDAKKLYEISVKIAEGKMSQIELKKYIMQNSSLNFEMMTKFNELYHIYDIEK
ncbi:type II toxin-antitoxin system death-on-curing family toxin [Fructobacillus ficulneus]|uniref:Death-on-curing family protein n=1 Tax=Fructobacillus ficulneus TaxID=157463 RepID=A0A0K8MKT5_9LACO|nr:type II toxin-antitoxin system death-on-curing family toxin [Fructobacillus ficulneus]GAP00485.1 Death-on-curing family protein [Fructobacillus ficulneus]